MKLYSAADLHSNNHFLTIIDEQDKRILEKRLPNELGVTLKTLEPYRAELTGFSAKLPADLLAAECDPRQRWPEELAEREGFELREVTLWIIKLLTDKYRLIPLRSPSPLICHQICHQDRQCIRTLPNESKVIEVARAQTLDG
jgi:hypothetical protein